MAGIWHQVSLLGGGVLLPYTHSFCFLSAVDVEGRPVLLSLAATRASLFGVFGRGQGLEPNRLGVRLLVSAGPLAPFSH